MNWLKRHKARSGTRSFIFQCVLAGWSALFVFVWLAIVCSAATEPRDPFLSQRDNDTATGGAVAGGSCCLIGGWAMIALPMGICAVVMFEAGPKAG